NAAGLDVTSRPPLFRRATLALILWCEVAFPGAGLESPGRDPHANFVDLPVPPGRPEAQEVLRVQLVGNARKGGAEILPEANFDVAAPAFLGHARQPGIWHVGHDHRLQTTRTDSRLRRRPGGAGGPSRGIEQKGAGG